MNIDEILEALDSGERAALAREILRRLAPAEGEKAMPPSDLPGLAKRKTPGPAEPSLGAEPEVMELEAALARRGAQAVLTALAAEGGQASMAAEGNGRQTAAHRTSVVFSGQKAAYAAAETATSRSGSGGGAQEAREISDYFQRDARRYDAPFAQY